LRIEFNLQVRVIFPEETISMVAEEINAGN
jgi:hypothetical protein